MAEPNNPANIERAERFVGLFLNEESSAPNYDQQHRIIRCAMNGSKGPAFWAFTGTPSWPWPGYNLPFYDVPGCTNHQTVGSDPELAKRLGEAMSDRQGKGDTVVNLAVTSLVANAYCWQVRRNTKHGS